MIIVRTIVFSLLLSLAILVHAAETSPPKPEQVTALTTSSTGRGLPNGSSSDEVYLEWLVPTEDATYGYTKENPIHIGGLLEGTGSRWSAQYFSSLLGPVGEPTRFERVKSCCGFPVSDPRLLEAGFKTGFLDVYQVTVQGSEPTLIYVTLYSEAKVYAPKGFTTRGNGL